MVPFCARERPLAAASGPAAQVTAHVTAMSRTSVFGAPCVSTRPLRLRVSGWFKISGRPPIVSSPWRSGNFAQSVFCSTDLLGLRLRPEGSPPSGGRGQLLRCLYSQRHSISDHANDVRVAQVAACFMHWALTWRCGGSLRRSTASRKVSLKPGTWVISAHISSSRRQFVRSTF